MNRIYFNEVALRDGFQIEPTFIPTDTKVALVDALSDCGYAKIEVTSFTSPKAIPMLRDADEVMGRIRQGTAWSTRCWCPTCAAPSVRWKRGRTNSTWSCPPPKPTTWPTCACRWPKALLPC